jgi:hypothetical protein
VSEQTREREQATEPHGASFPSYRDDMEVASSYPITGLPGG